MSRVRYRFGQWIRDTYHRKYDQEWLDHPYEVGLRHYTAKKNKTDGVDAEPIIHVRYIIAFIVPITYTIKSFFAKKDIRLRRLTKCITHPMLLHIVTGRSMIALEFNSRCQGGGGNSGLVKFAMEIGF